ncbi:MAG: hypothetical protein IJS15_14845 [Victivallales bacterium]|nr:hypothetical protein [Victivallales bacterium]
MARHQASYRTLAKFALGLASLLLAAACARKPEAESKTPPSIPAKTQENWKMQKQTTLILAVGDASFTIALADTEAARELLRHLPLSLDMAELNGNEKYASLDSPLPSKAENVRRIEAGDVMLWGKDCLVVFYKSFETPYSYTRIGKIDNASKLADALGKGSVTVTFQTVSKPQEKQ